MTDLLTRREFLRTAVKAAGYGAAFATLPLGIRRALAIPAHTHTGTIEDVEHIVVFMQENRSFDHYFGTLRGVRGFGDTRAIRLPNGKPVWHQPTKSGHGEVLPFRPAAADLGMRFIEDLPHDWETTHDAWNGGIYDRWVPAKGATTMAYLARRDIPFHYQLADAFTICDAYHCSVLSETDPNRYYMWTGWCGNDGKGGGPVVDDAEAGYAWLTYPEVLERAGVSWKVYQDVGTGLDKHGHWGWTGNAYIGNYGDNSLLYFNQYRDAKPGSALYDKARRGGDLSADGNYLEVLRRDVENDTLPQVSWIVSPEAFSEHPNWPANYGAWYIDKVLQILTSNPKLWSRTVLLIDYDENDGFFDHMAPPFAPASEAMGLSTVDTRNEYFPGSDDYTAGPYGLGVRVPMIVVSPWSKGGWVCSELFDHTSVIRFIEKRFGHQHDLAEPNITAWRRAICGDLTSAFNFANPNDTFPELPSTSAYAPPDHQRHPNYVPKPPAVQAVPKQEPGTRPSRALPYELRVRLDAVDTKDTVKVEFINTGTGGANFLLYRARSGDVPRSYTVEAGKRLVDHLPLNEQGGYDFMIHGPNGFLRRFAGKGVEQGDERAARTPPKVVESYDASKGNLRLQLTNTGAQDCQFAIANAYDSDSTVERRVKPHDTVSLHRDLRDTHGWYDLTVTSSAWPGFRWRLAGHVETGHASMSDPALGSG